ncbi:uncharacterized protein LOC106557752 [Canis lupus familiaris]|uniref:uncharacterized protein LOC106557752 n=1 Tax=Canis lupus familiaris TaxID=9615 RepID=UPI0015F14494|nr:uncharacterized protein LOC106557752 [Canis lupus familiaris]XP_038314103.1 uncharacterized protein LOC106557752 [Canis lupus familiaris]XP_038429305.1 uncharacterized protein LOC106557752 [Canis lupus familiaris]
MGMPRGIWPQSPGTAPRHSHLWASVRVNASEGRSSYLDGSWIFRSFHRKQQKRHTRKERKGKQEKGQERKDGRKVRWQPMPQDALTSARAGQQKCVCSDHLLQHNLDLQVAIWTSCPGNIELLVFLWLKAHFQNVITGSTASPGFCHPSWSLQTAPPPNMFPVFVIVVAAASPSNVFGSNFKNPPLPIITNKNSVFPNSLSMNHC